jgi:uncharacterized protein
MAITIIPSTGGLVTEEEIAAGPMKTFAGLSLVTGFHGIGATGYWTVKYLIQHLKAERVAFIDSDLIAPITSTEDGRITTPYEIFRKDNLVFFKSEAPPYKNEDMRFFKDFADFVINAGFKEAALIGGLDSRLRHDQSTYRLVKTSTYQPEGQLKDAQVLEEGQIIVGPVSVLLNRFEARGFPAYSILSYASAERVDPRAAAAAINTLSQHYSVQVDLEPLLKGAQVLEAELEKHEDHIRRQDRNIYT